MEQPPPGPRRLITLSQAMGMVSVQADCTVDEALTLMADRAQDIGCSVYEIAFAVVEGVVRFDP